MESIRITGEALWHRMESAVERVRQRLQKATAVLEQAGLPYAIVGGNAVRIWVAQIDEAAVRNTRDVDILIRRNDLAAIRTALEAVGFIYRHMAGITPIALGLGAGGESRAPLGVAVVGGMFFSTLLTFFVVPATYVAVARLQESLRRSPRPAERPVPASGR